MRLTREQLAAEIARVRADRAVCMNTGAALLDLADRVEAAVRECGEIIDDEHGIPVEQNIARRIRAVLEPVR